MNIRKKIAAVLCATALAVTGASVVAPEANAFPFTPRTGIGTGFVAVAVGATTTYCTQQGLAPGCGTTGSGILTPNQWSNNEIVTAYHVVEPIIANDGNHMFITFPGSGVVWPGYIQKTDPANDIAVIWIYGGSSGLSAWPTPAPQFQEASVASTNVSNGATVQAQGNENDIFSSPPGAWYSSSLVSVQNNNFNGTPNTWHDSYAGVDRTIYNTIQTTGITNHGDSGGPLLLCNPVCFTVVGFNELLVSGHSYAVQMAWAQWDMLNTHP